MSVATRHEVVIVQEWMYGRLSADATLAGTLGVALGGLPGRIHEDAVPGGGALPAVVIQYQGGAVLRIVGPDRLWSDMLFLVKVSGQGASTRALEPAAVSINRLLDAQAGTVTGGRVEACVFEQPFKLSPVEDGVQYRQLGSIFRCQARAT